MQKLNLAALVAAVCLVLFFSGLLTGRQFPAHHYERFASGSYLFDSTTGRTCNPIVNLTADNPYIAIAGGTDPAKDDPFAAYGGHATTQAVDLDNILAKTTKPADSVPVCGK